ncbi:MAG: ATP-NAD kinase family protein [Gammaproteobacteria bacterium]|nr:ATP-NAD kinase family protein [Gammaproteobacteria bacterium]
MLKIALLINPVAGIGGTVGLKGSDGRAVQQSAAALGGVPRGVARTRRALARAQMALEHVNWVTWGGSMGAELLAEFETESQVLEIFAGESTATETRRAAARFLDENVDLLVFAGGDGTARDILAAIENKLPVLGIPAGVKMHSGVFATTPEVAGEVLVRLVRGGLVRSTLGDVRDLDEVALRAGSLQPKFYGELLVPELGGFLQHTKQGGRESESLALEEITADVVERIEADSRVYILGPGSSVMSVKRALKMEASLIGVDVWHAGTQLGKDVNAQWLHDRFAKEHGDPPVLIVSFTRVQGFLFGRGNQQLSSQFLENIPRRDVWVIGTRSKLLSLEGRPLLIDTDDPELDRAWSGLLEVTTGYEDRMWYRVDHRAGF